jgi:ferritin-like metal-binding protein YciE
MKGVVDIARGEKAGRNARDGYATEHMEIAAYQLLERVAERAGDQETVEVARQNRSEEEAMAKKLDSHWDRFAELSLEEAGVSAGARR